MSITRIHSYLVHPSKGSASPPVISGVQVPHTGKLFRMLEQLDREAEGECDIDIVFRSKDGTQQNDCRDLLLRHLSKKDLPTGHAVATRLQAVTDNRSGLGLLFLIIAKNQHGLRLMVSRFPAEDGVMAEERGSALSVTFVDKVFMKSQKTYKSVLYRCPNISTGFWDGIAVDRQMDDLHGTANYWIGDFLVSDLRNTAAQGTKRVAVAIQTAIRKEQDPTVRQELMLAAQVLRGKGGRHTSAAKLSRDLSLSGAGEAAFKAAFPRKDLFGSTFKFDSAEYDSVLQFRAVELDNGATMIADDTRFDEIFVSESAGREGVKQRFTTEGKVVSTRLQKKAQ